ncbi:hypothetical protein C7C46_17935 [Streptomyces tateyamensis]|uniref:Uncharacterized protein n=1 Tax=Streptomyces tateyamensis TaxID=565073 RepID=A0A2V4N1P7_9ACTN|nr:hypothetical protein [Streptomyces tateyamensis]PYC77849.1 hypothetical protein C7C46_17935 [Streptomyces tateyamensis]
MYRPGDIASTALHGLPGLGRWAVYGSALILATDPGELLLYVYQATLGADFFARGPISIGLHGSGLALNDPVTTGLAPTRIQLGEITNSGDPSSAVDDLVQRARAELEPHWTARGDGPLTVDQLPVLDLSCSVLAERRAGADLAKAARDRIVRRLRAGGVTPAQMSRPGMSVSQIYQINRSAKPA